MGLGIPNRAFHGVDSYFDDVIGLGGCGIAPDRQCAHTIRERFGDGAGSDGPDLRPPGKTWIVIASNFKCLSRGV
jgi:hypothetical protein